jgi:chitin synthase
MAAIILSCLTLYLIIASIKCAVTAPHGGAANSVMLLSIAVTYGCMLITDLLYPHRMLTSLILFLMYVFSSILVFDPWNMVTSVVPNFYKLLASKVHFILAVKKFLPYKY